jgi:hypothetical protein
MLEDSQELQDFQIILFTDPHYPRRHSSSLAVSRHCPGVTSNTDCRGDRAAQSFRKSGRVDNQGGISGE